MEGYKTKNSVVVVYTGDSKGKTSASLGLLVRALGNRWKVAYVQFIKHWGVGEHVFIRDIMPLYKDQLMFIKGGKGFYNAGDMSAEFVTEEQHKAAARKTYEEALKLASSGDYDLVICDEAHRTTGVTLAGDEQASAFVRVHDDSYLAAKKRL